MDTRTADVEFAPTTAPSALTSARMLHAGMFGLDCAACHTTNDWFARYNGSHPGNADEGGRGVNHGGAGGDD